LSLPKQGTILGTGSVSPSTYVIKPAVRQTIQDHGLSVEEVEAVLAAPEQKVEGTGSRFVFQSRTGGSLIRVVVETDREPPEVVTVYRTSKVAKYWQVHDAD